MGISIEGLLFHRSSAFFNAGPGDTCCLAFRLAVAPMFRVITPVGLLTRFYS